VENRRCSSFKLAKEVRISKHNYYAAGHYLLRRNYLHVNVNVNVNVIVVLNANVLRLDEDRRQCKSGLVFLV